MSRTDKDAPEWVRALHNHNEGRPTEVSHSGTCEEHPLGPRMHIVRHVLRADAEAHGWTIVWSCGMASKQVSARVPQHPHPCDLDEGPHSRCGRWASDRSRWYTLSPPSREEIHSCYYGPERAAVRDSLRAAVKEYRGTGDVLDTDPPTRQTRGSMWTGGYWD